MVKSKKMKSKICEIGINIDEKIKYVVTVDEFDINFLQLNYNKFKARNTDNDDVVPLWSLQQNKLDSNYYGFEIISGMNENSNHPGISNTVNESTNIASIDNKNKGNVIKKLNTNGEDLDFATYMKLVNVFNESEHYVKIEGTSIKVDYEETVKKRDVNTDQLVTLHVLSGEKLKVSMSNFHGFWQSGEGVQCRVCMVMVEDVEGHKMEIQHMKRIASKISNRHCVRKIGPIWNHCILCNEVIENVEFHLKANTAHTKHLEQALKHSTKYQPNANVCTTSEECNTVKSNLLSNSKIRSNNLKQPINNSNQNDDKSVIQNLESHIKKAVINYDTGLFSPNENFVSCNVCNRKMLDSQIKSHMEGKSHKAQLLKIKNEGFKEVAINCNLASDSGKKNAISNQCKPKENSVSSKIFTQNLKKLKDEENSTYKKKIAVNNDGSVSTSTEFKNVLCDICNRKMQSDQFIEHIKGKPHKARLLKIKNKDTKEAGINSCSSSVTGIKNTRSNEHQPKQNYASDKTDIQNFIYKDKEVRNDNTNGIDKKHFVLDNDKRVVTLNKTENFAFCNVCNRKMQFNQLGAHIIGKSHKAELLKFKNEGINKVAANYDLPSSSGIKNTTSNEYHSKQNTTCDKIDSQNFKVHKDTELRNVESNLKDKKHLATDNDKSVLTVVKSNTECETGATTIPENFHQIYQKDLARKLNHRYDDILSNSLMDPISESRPSTSSPRYTNQQKYNDNAMKEIGASSAHNVKTETISVTTNTEELKYLMIECTNFTIGCKVCRVSFFNTENSVLKHVASEEHIREYTYLLKKNTIKLENETLLTCEACKVFMCVGKELVHIKTEHHKKEIVTKIRSSELTNKRLIYCFRCDSILYLCFDKMYEHYSQKCCTEAIFSKHCVSIVDINNLYCCYCSKYLHESELFDHILSPRHLSIAQSYYRPPYRICYQMQCYMNANELYCKVCNEPLWKSLKCLLSHLDSKLHTSKYRKLLIDNKIKECANANNMFYCKPCKVYIQLQNEVHHIESFDHRQRLEKSKELSSFILLMCGCISLFLFFKCYW